jgi:hypothetical protein
MRAWAVLRDKVARAIAQHDAAQADAPVLSAHVQAAEEASLIVLREAYWMAVHRSHKEPTAEGAAALAEYAFDVREIIESSNEVGSSAGA